MTYGYEDDPNTEIGVNESIYEMLFAGTEDYDNKPYWLASPGFGVDPGYLAYFGPGAAGVGYVFCGGGGLFYSYGVEFFGGLGVRPVVSLKSGVNVDQIKVISGNRDEVDWPDHGSNAGGPS